MFKEICIIPSEGSFPTDIGFIAENLLFYEKVNLIVSMDTLPVLLKQCELDLLKELVNRGNLNLYMKENFLTFAEKKLPNGNIVNNILLVEGENLSIEDYIFRSLYSDSKRQGYSKRVTKQLLNITRPIKYQDGFCEFIHNDLDDISYVRQSISEILRHYNSDLNLPPDNIDFEKRQVNGDFIFANNLNFDQINKLVPNNRIQGVKTFILKMNEARGDLHLAESLKSEIATSPIQTELIKIKFSEISKKCKHSANEMFQFNDFTLGNGYAIREAINSQEKNMKDFLLVLDKASKYRDWLHSINDDKSIIKEYHNAITKETWVNKLPVKGLRWSFFTGAGLLLDSIGAGGLGTMLGIGLSAGDAFLLEKLLKGWNPSVFIKNELSKFVSN